MLSPFGLSLVCLAVLSGCAKKGGGGDDSPGTTTSVTSGGSTVGATNSNLVSGVGISGPASPTDSATPNVTWTEGTGAASYTLLVGTAARCPSPLQTYSDLTTTSQALTNLADGDYILCLLTADAKGSLAYAENSDYALTVKATPPGDFTLSTLIKNLSANGLPAFTWGASSTANSYKFSLSRSADCSSPVTTADSLSSPAYTVSSALGTGSYYACVTASDAAGNLTKATNNAYQFLVNAPVLIGQTSFTTAAAANPPTSRSLSSAGAVKWDGTHLIVADTSNSRVLIWNSFPTTPGQAADLVLGGSMTSIDTFGGSAVHMAYPTDIAVTGTKLLVVDSFNHRVMVWNSFPTTNDQAPSFYLGQSASTSTNANGGATPTKATMIRPTGIYTDGTKLVVSDYGNKRVLVWTTFPTTTGQAANFVLGQANGTSNSSCSASATCVSPGGVTSDGRSLYVTDNAHNRVLVWTTFPSSDNAAADLAIGQPSLTSQAGCSSTTMDLDLPDSAYATGVATDGTHLLVADFDHSRVLQWNYLPTNFCQAPNAAIGQADLNSLNPNAGHGSTASATSLIEPVGISTDGTVVYIADSNNRVVSLPLK